MALAQVRSTSAPVTGGVNPVVTTDATGGEHRGTSRTTSSAKASRMYSKYHRGLGLSTVILSTSTRLHHKVSALQGRQASERSGVLGSTPEHGCICGLLPWT